MFKKLDHVGVVVKNLDEAIKLYGSILHLAPSSKGIITLSDLGVRLALLPIGDNFIELLEPIGTESRFARHLREKGEGLFHLSIFTEDFDAEVIALKKKGYRLEEEATAQLYTGFKLRLAWLVPADTGGVWIELIDVASRPPALKKQ